jgi:DNA-binding NarL/FixJ family response regulator
MIRLAIVDDEALIVQLLKGFLEQEKEFSVVLMAHDGEEFLDKFQQYPQEERPEIVLMDMRMKKMHGDEAIKILKEKYPETKAITLSSHYKESFLGYMLKVGVNAFVPKGISPDLLREVIWNVHTKGFYFLEEQVEAMRSQIDSNSPEPVLSSTNTLTKREIEILRLLCEQHTTPEIAEKLFLSKRTVETHRNNLLLKTGAKNTAGLIIYAVQKKLVNIDGYEFS